MVDSRPTSSLCALGGELPDDVVLDASIGAEDLDEAIAGGSEAVDSVVEPPSELQHLVADLVCDQPANEPADVAGKGRGSLVDFEGGGSEVGGVLGDLRPRIVL